MTKHLQLSIFVFLITFSFLHCRQKPKHVKAIIVKETMLDSIPSGSGIEKHNDSLFIIGDDAAFAYKLSVINNGYKTLQVSQQVAINSRIDRNSKPDYESAVILNFRGGDYLFAFGSGSSSPTRDSLLIIDVTRFTVDTIVNIKRFYDYLSNTSKTDEKDWNLEAAAIINNKMILFNRGNNFMFSFDAEAFVDYILTKGVSPPQIFHAKAALPSIEQYPARLSGAATMDKELVFSASVEKTTDWRSDGPVLGSYIGQIDERGRISFQSQVIYPDGRVSKDKIESLTFIRRAENGDIILAAIADNDDGKSKLLEMLLVEQKQ